MEERRTCTAEVVGSSPTAGSSTSVPITRGGTKTMDTPTETCPNCGQMTSGHIRGYCSWDCHDHHDVYADRNKAPTATPDAA
jgi:hypothetical protein